MKGRSFRSPIFVIAALIAVLSLLLAACGTPQAAQPSGQSAAQPKSQIKLTMGSSASSSSQYPYAVAIAKIINDNVPEVSITVAESGATTENIERTASGDFNIATSVGFTELSAAFNGLAPYEGKEKKNLRGVFLQGVNMIPWAVREDSGLKSIYDFEGKKINPGFPGSGMEKNNKRFFEVLGIKPDWSLGTVPEAVDAIKDRRIMGFAKAGVGYHLDASHLDLLSTTKLRFFGFPEEARQKLDAALPLIAWITVPKGAIPELKDQDAMLTWAGLIGMISNADVPEDAVYKMTKAVISNQKDLLTVWPALEGFDIAKQTIEISGNLKPQPPLHAGAVKYYREIGITVPDGLLPPELKK